MLFSFERVDSFQEGEYDTAINGENFMMKPLGNRVLIKRAEAEKTKGGILLPDTAKEKPKMGQVVAVGPGKANEEGKIVPVQVKVGEKVLFSGYAGNEVKMELEGDYLIVTEEEILGVLV